MDAFNKYSSIVYITGAGPGDPDLLTLKAKEIIEKSEVIVYDNLVSNEILDLALFLNSNVKLIYGGRVGYNEDKSLGIEKLCNLLSKLSKEHKIICRLKGGDPNVFGRLGEEAIFLKEHGINFEIIPGVSSITAVPAYSGIPLTHRDYSSSFTVLKGSGDPYDPEEKIHWESFDAVNGTLVLLMGTRNLPKIVNKLLELGRAGSTPLAIIQRGTTSEQKTFATTIGSVKDDLKKLEIKTPSLIVIGEVVKLKEVLDWYEKKPLLGKKVLVTRGKEQSFSFASKLIKAGAKPISCPIVRYDLNEKEVFNKSIISNLTSFDWIFFTSQNAVRFFFDILNRNYLDSRALSKAKIAAVGFKTKCELEKYNIKPDFVPKRFSFENLVKELQEFENLQNKKILIPTQNLQAFSIQHSAFNLDLFVWHIYNAYFEEELNCHIINQIKNGIDVITLLSSNTASHFFKLVEKHNLTEHIKDVKIATIGDETAKRAKELFGKVDIIAAPFTEEGLIGSMEKYFARVKINVKD